MEKIPKASLEIKGSRNRIYNRDKEVNKDNEKNHRDNCMQLGWYK